MSATKTTKNPTPTIEQYRQYTEAKNQLPPDLTPKEYEAAIRRLADKYNI